jgi:septum formation topological specificity factor MinE
VTVDSDTVRVRAERSDTVSMLTVDIEIPTEATKAAA